MIARTRNLAFTIVALLLAVGGWIGVVLARWDRVADAAFPVLVVALIAAGFRAWFAPTAKGRDWWFGFAAFGLFHLLSPSTGPRKPLLSAGVDRLAEVAFGGAWDENGNPAQDANGGRVTPSRLGRSIAAVRITQNESPYMGYPHYVTEVTKTFAVLAFGLIGGLVASYLGRKAEVAADESTARPRVPRLGLAAMVLVGMMAGLTFVLDSRPEIYQEGWFVRAPGCQAGHFALYQTEALLVLFAALEARFGGRSTRPWWLGFALFGGAYLLVIDTAMFDLLPSRWLKPWHQVVLNRFVAECGSLTVSIRGMILMDQATQEFFRLGYSWAPLLGFLPAVWFGSGVARGVDWLARRRATMAPTVIRRSSITRMMAVVVAIGLLLAAARGQSEWWLILVCDSIAALLVFAALRAGLGRGAGRAWWFGFALVGGVDFLLWATRPGSTWSVPVPWTPWPYHQVIERVHLAAYERSVGRAVQKFPMLFSAPTPENQAILDAYLHGRSVLLMSLCLPLAWIGGLVAQYFDRRSVKHASSPDPHP